MQGNEKDGRASSDAKVGYSFREGEAAGSWQRRGVDARRLEDSRELWIAIARVPLPGVECGRIGYVTVLKSTLGGSIMRATMLWVIGGVAAVSVASAQVGTAVKESAKAVSESAQDVGNQIKAATETGAEKEVSKAKAHIHRAKAKAHRHEAKEAVKAATK